jgi:hypothetical protein
MLLMMVIVMPETCCASNKICNKNHLLYLVGMLFPQIRRYLNEGHSSEFDCDCIQFKVIEYTLMERGINRMV